MKENKKKIIFTISAIMLGIALAIFGIQENSTNDSTSNLYKEQIFETFQADHNFLKQSVDGTQVNDFEDYIVGKQSLKLVTGGNGEWVLSKKDNLPSLDFADKYLKVIIKISNTKKVGKLYLKVSEDNFESYKTYWIHKNNITPNAEYFQNDKWSTIIISLTQTEDTGKPDLSKINSIEIGLKDKGTGPLTVWLNSLSLIENNNHAILTFTFDDAMETQFTNAIPILEKYNFSATSYIPTQLIGNPGKLNLDQLKEMQNKHGWDISSHTLRHMDLTNKRWEHTFEDEISLSKQFLLENGLVKGAEHFAYPFGHFDNDLAMHLVKKYYKTARGVRGDVETIPVADWHRLRVVYAFNYTQPSEINDKIQLAIKNKDWVILVFHGIVDEAKNFHSTYPKSNFEKIVDLVKESGIEVKTVSEVYNELSSKKSNL